ncbi:hypothetical protein LQW54_006278 [Pestalotiopsis sp. IQ-011]
MPKKLTERAESVARILKTRFDHDGRYFLEAYVGSGVQADVYRIRKRSGAEAGAGVNFGPERVAVKVPAPPETHRWNHGGDLFDEKEALKLFSGAMHVVRILEMHEGGPDGDPLSKNIEGAAVMPTKDWMYMEWLDNGNLIDFRLRAGKPPARPVPNRLMWRIFLCLVRMVIVCAWSEVHVTGTSKLEEMQEGHPKMIYTNTDMHGGNMVFGDFVPDSPDHEHRLSPILKMIDLGFIYKTKTETEEKWKATVKEMTMTIGEEMRLLLEVGNRPTKDLDSDLKKIVTWCNRRKRDYCPDLEELVPWVENAVKGRDAAWYKREMPNMSGEALLSEEDDSIRQYVIDMIVNASTEAEAGP